MAQKIRLEQIEDIGASNVIVSAFGNLVSTDVQAALQELQGDIDTLNSLGYISEANLTIGTITSTTIPINIDTGTDIVLEAATSSLAGIMLASDKEKIDFITVSQEVDLDTMEQDLIDIITLSGRPANSTHLGNLSATGFISDNITIEAAFSELDTNLGAMQLLTGISKGTDNLGTFAGDIIDDNQDIKAALQDLENGLTTINSTGYITEIDVDGTGYDSIYFHGTLPAYSYSAGIISVMNSFTFDDSTITDANASFTFPYQMAGRVFIPSTPTADRTHTLPYIFAYHDFEFVVKGVVSGGFDHTLSSTATFEDIQTGTSAATLTLEDSTIYRIWYNSADTTYYYQKFDDPSGYLTQITIDGVGYDELDTVNFSTFETPSGTLQVLNGMVVDAAYFNNTTRVTAAYADFAGKFFIPQTPTADRSVTLPSTTIPANNMDLEFYILGVEDSGFGYSVGDLGFNLTNISTGSTTSTVDLLDSIIYHFWYDYSANTYYYYTTEAAGAASPLTTKGDIWVYGTGDTRLAAGTDGYILSLNSAQSTGLEWIPNPTGNMANATFYDNTGGQTLTTTRTVVNLDTTMANVGSIFTLATDEVTISETAYYTVSFAILGNFNGVTRESFYGFIQVDTGGGFSDIDGSKIAGYSRITGEHISASGSFTRQFTAGDKIRISAEATATDSVNTVADGTRLSIVQLKGVKGDTGATGSVSPLTTKGDLMGHNGSTEVRVAVGTDGQIVEADSTQSAGWKWAAKPAGFSGGTYSNVSSLHASLSSTPQDRLDDADQVYIIGQPAVTGSITAGTTLFVVNNAPSATRYFSIVAEQVGFKGVMAFQVDSSGNVSTVLSNLSSGDDLYFDGVSFYGA